VSGEANSPKENAMTNGDTRTIAWRNDSEIAAINGGSSERLMRDVKSFVFEPSEDGVALLRFFFEDVRVVCVLGQMRMALSRGH
jgi:hypothetical protein